MGQKLKINLHIRNSSIISFILFLLNLNLASATSSENFSDYKLPYQTITSLIDKGESEISIPENLTTWIFEDGTFIPQAKVQGGIDAEKDFHLVSENIEANRASTNPKYPRTIFDRELKMLENSKYEQNGSKMKKIKCG